MEMTLVKSLHMHFFYLRVLFLTFLFVRSFFISQIYISVYGTDVREAVIFFGADYFEFFVFAGWIIEYQHSEILIFCQFLRTLAPYSWLYV